MPGANSRPRIGVLVVAYNAASSLAGVLDRIPTDFRHRVTTVMVFDDHSDDSTYLVGLGYVLNRDGEERNEGSELLDVNY